MWGVDYEEFQLYFRTGVTSDEQTGRNWCLIDLPYADQYGAPGPRSRHNSGRSDTSDATSCSDVSFTTMRSDLSSLDLADSGTLKASKRDLRKSASPPKQPSISDTVNTNSFHSNGNTSESRTSTLKSSSKSNKQLPNSEVSVNVLSTSMSSSSLNDVADIEDNEYQVSLKMTSQTVSLGRGPPVSDTDSLSPPVDGSQWSLEDNSLSREEDLFYPELSEDGQLNWVWVSPGCSVAGESDIKAWLVPAGCKWKRHTVKSLIQDAPNLKT